VPRALECFDPPPSSQGIIGRANYAAALVEGPGPQGRAGLALAPPRRKCKWPDLPLHTKGPSMFSRRAFLRASLGTSTLVALTPTVPTYWQELAVSGRKKRRFTCMEVQFSEHACPSFRLPADRRNPSFSAKQPFLQWARTAACALLAANFVSE
jgi:hypothetical protein